MIVQPHGETVRYTRDQVNNDVDLITYIVSENVLGIRADIEVPKKFLGHFRYRWGFLILTSFAIPIGLVRFLTSQWIKTPFNLWLNRNVSYRKFLSSVPKRLTVRKPANPSPSFDDDEEGEWPGHTAYEDESFDDMIAMLAQRLDC